MNLAEARSVLTDLAGTLPRGAGSVRLRLDGPIARLVLDHPEARGAVTLHMMIDLVAAVERLRHWPGAALILESSDPRAFCSGGHLTEVQAALDEPWKGRCMASAMGSVLDELLCLPVVSVAALDGPAIGGGSELAVATDHRVMAAGARIHFVHASLGVAPGWGGAGRLVAHVGRTRALRILTTARSLDAVECERIGLADAVVPSGAVAAAEAFLAPVLALPAAAVRAAKAQIASAWRIRGPAGLIPEVDAFASVWAGPAHREALRSR